MKIFRSILILLGVALVTACSGVPQMRQSEADSVAVKNRLGLDSQPALAVVEGKPAILYEAPDGHVTFRRGGRVVVLDQGMKIKGGRFLQLHAQGSRVYAAWWSHEDGKALYFTRSEDGGKTFSPVAVVNQAHGVLNPYHLIIGGEGKLGMVYADEREPKYEVYASRSVNDGVSWSAPDLRLDPPLGPDVPSFAYEPQAARIGNRWIAVWRDIGDATQHDVQRLLVSVSTDEGVHWSAAKVIYTTDGVMSQLKLVALQGHFVLAFMRGEHIELMHAGPNAETWSAPQPVPGFETPNSGGFEMSAAASGPVTVLWSAQRGMDKPAIFAGSYDLASNRWLGEPFRVDKKIANNTMSLSPTLVTTPDGTSVAAWVDFRNIIPQIYVATSKDGGQHWSEPKNIGIDGGEFMSAPQLVLNGKSILLGYEAYPTDDHANLLFTWRPLEMDASGQFVGLPVQSHYSDAQREAMLKKRVQELWEYRIRGDFGPTYKLFDPAFRLAVSKQEFDKAQAQIVYRDVKWIGAKINGNVAQATVHVKLQVLPLKVTDRVINIPEQETDVVSEWVWIKDDWYLVYKGFMNQTFLSY
ncbi:hypothetical protein [Thiomonas sp.]